MNKFIFVGNLTRDFELHEAKTNFATGSIALNRSGDGADFVNLKGFGKTAELLTTYGKKGQKMAFEGHVQTGSYEKDGKVNYTTDFVIDRWEFAGSKNSDNSAPAQEAPSFMDIPDNIADELPFN